MVILILLLFINLSLWKCASTENHKGVEIDASETKSVTDMITDYFEPLLHKVLAYDAESIGHRNFDLAVENRFYDVFFELSKDPIVWKGNAFIKDSFFFDCYNNYVYNSPSSSRYMWNKMNSIHPTEYDRIRKINPDGLKLSLRELSAWISVCIYRRAPEEKYAPYLAQIPSIFLEIIQEYIYIYSLITFDIVEKDYFHEFIVKLLDKYFGDNENLKSDVRFTRLLNDVRYGNGSEYVYDEIFAHLEDLNKRHIVMLIIAASKSNNKALVKQIYDHTDFSKWILEMMVESECPHRFKVYFDLIEDEPLQDINDKPNFAGTNLIQTIISNKFKITKTITLPFGIMFDIHSPPEYIDVGFASQYEIVLNKESQYELVQSLIQKMFEDAAKAGAEELIQLITYYCGEQVNTSNIIHNSHFFVSYEVIRILIQHQYLIVMLENCRVLLFCNDERINDRDILNFEHVIIKRQPLVPTNTNLPW